MLCEFYNCAVKKSAIDISPKDVDEKIRKAQEEARREMVKTSKEHVLYAIRLYDGDSVKRTLIFRHTALDDQELDLLIQRFPNSIIFALHKGTCLKACIKMLSREKSREIRPITLREANDFVNNNHRHHNGTVGCKFSIGLYEVDKLIGVAICGRPVSRYLDNGDVCEINRLCTLGDDNACSMLYGACARIAKHMGYKKIITYILQSESGTTLKASNFVCEGEAGGTHWTGKRNRGQLIPAEKKMRWAKTLI